MQLLMFFITILIINHSDALPERRVTVLSRKGHTAAPRSHLETDAAERVPPTRRKRSQKGSSYSYQSPLDSSSNTAALHALLRGVPALSQGTGVGAAPEHSPGATPETEPHAKPESEATAEAEPESEATALSEVVTPETSAEPEVEPESWPEPGPQWSLAFKEWKSAWEIHIYFFAVSFLLMGFYSAYFVIFNVYDGLNKKFLSLSLNIMVLLFGLTRALVLFLDPYHQGGVVKVTSIMRLMWSIGGPCLTAADSLIILALLEMSRLTLTTPKLQQPGIISVIIAFHFIFVIITDFVVSAFVSAKGMILFCQIFFVIWGGILGTGYFRLGYVLDKKLFGHKTVKEKADKLYIMLIYASGAANYILCIIMVYTGAGVFGVYSDVKFVDAWSWWILQTLLRLSEVVTCILIFTVSAKRTRVKRAMDEITSTAADDSESGLSVKITSLQKLSRRIMSRFKTFKVEEVNIIPDQNEHGAEPESLAAWEKPKSTRARKMSMFSAMQNESLESQSTAHAQNKPRRLSMFSAMNDAAVQSVGARAPKPRQQNRRVSMFSAMQNATIAAVNSRIEENIFQYDLPVDSAAENSSNIENDCFIESLEPAEQTNFTEEVKVKSSHSLRKPVKRMFSFGLTNETAEQKRSPIMEGITEESEYEEKSETSTMWSLVERFGSVNRLLLRISSLRSFTNKTGASVDAQEIPEENSTAHENTGFHAVSDSGLSEVSN